MNMFEELYTEYRRIKEMNKAVMTSGSMERKLNAYEALIEFYDYLDREFDFDAQNAFTYFMNSMELGNRYLNVDTFIEDISSFVGALRENGVEEFTLSIKYRTTGEFRGVDQFCEAGCVVVGTTNVYRCFDADCEQRLTRPALIFKVL